MSECTCDDIILELTPEGQDGNGIVSVEKISTVGVISTYRITFTNGTYFDYQVTDGSSIASITKTSTVGLVDTYTVTLTDGTQTTFTVTNGEKGDPGNTGNGIASITKTGTVGLVDTYTILFTDGTTTTYTVTNGEQGEPGDTGNGIESIEKTGTVGLADTYRITFTDGDHFDYDVANGADGEPGPTGNGIASIEKISTVGLVDTYRITFTDGTTYDYTVTNGSSSGGGSWGSITGTLSDQTDLQTALDSKADIIKVNASGSVVSITDGAPYAVDALTVGVEPVQDLHGQSSPYPASGGKNLFDPRNVNSGSGLTVTCNDDSTITITGTLISNYHNCTTETDITDLLEDGQKYYLSQTSYTNSSYVHVYVKGYKADESSPSYWQCSTGTVNFTVNKTTYSRYTIYNSTVSVSGWGGVDRTITYGVQLEKGASATDFSPYWNICPISGHTTATITRTGRNLLKTDGLTYTVPSSTSFANTTKRTFTANSYFYGLSTNNYYLGNAMTGVTYSENTFTFTVTSSGYCLCLPVIGLAVGSTYTISGTGTNLSFRYAFYQKDGTYISGTSGSTFTVPSNTYFVIVGLTAAIINSETTALNIQLELGSTASPYEAYQGQSVTVDLGSTVYCGVVDVVNGALRVTHAEYVITKDSAVRSSSMYGDVFSVRYTLPNLPKSGYIGNNQYCNAFKVSQGQSGSPNYEASSFSVYVSGSDGIVGFGAPTNVTDVSGFKAMIENIGSLKIYYPLATPIEVTGLTPAQISTLLGNNVLWADTGDTNVTYRADTALYIDRKVAEANTLTRAMIADSATADGKAPKSLSTGDLIIVGDELRKATENIGSGNAITASNSTVATLADVIKALQ